MHQFVQESNHLNGLQIVSLNANFYEVLEIQQYCADPGHLNRAGGVLFSKELQKILDSAN